MNRRSSIRLSEVTSATVLVLFLPALAFFSPGLATASLQVRGPDVAWADACVDLRLAVDAVPPRAIARLAARPPDDTMPPDLEFHEGHGCTRPTDSLVLPASGEVAFSFRSSALGIHQLIVSTGFDSVDHVLDLALPGYDPAELAHRALVIYNVNAPDAQFLASEYAQARGVDGSRLCGVELPTGQVAHADELLGARETAVQCLCDSVEAEIAFECSVENLDQIVALSPVTHLVLVRGIPPRLTGTGWPQDTEEPSFDFYWSYHLSHSGTIFGTGVGSYNPSYPRTASVHGYLPPLDPATHGAFAYGRIEAIDTGRTQLQLIRTLSAEGKGVRGNILTEHGLEDEVSQAARNLTSSFSDDCIDYLSHEPFVFGDPDSSWPHETCRWGSTGSTSQGSQNGKLPGSVNTTIKHAVGVEMLFGSEPAPNGQAGFNDFSTMTKWRKSDDDCIELCEDFGSSTLVEICKQTSDDIFRELNSECVGGAPGFMGHQIRSYPVQYYGFAPAGWSMPTSGAIEKTPPVVLSEPRVGGEPNRHAHFGVHSRTNLDDNTCTRADGTVVSCPERIAVALEKNVRQSPPLVVSGQRDFHVSLRYRNQASPGGTLQFSLRFDNQATMQKQWRHFNIAMDEQHLGWTTASTTLTVQEGEVSGVVTGILVRLRSLLSHDLIGFLDLDDVRVVDLQSGDDVLAPDIGSFTFDEHHSTVSGDWAANVIDRMGGIACWGSSSHHLTLGWAFNPSREIAGALFSGRTLGESLVMGNAKSGIIYGDPLYRPLAIKIWHPEGIRLGEPDRLRLWSDSPEEDKLIRLNVLHGTDNRETVSWSLSACEAATVEECGPSEGEELLSGVGTLEGFELHVPSLFPPGADFDGVFRLTAVNENEAALAVSNYAHVEWHDNPRPPCPADLNGDDVVNDADVNLLGPYLPCTADDLTADLDGDGDVDDDDLDLLNDYLKLGDLRGDLNGDGKLNLGDIIYLTQRYCGAKDFPPEYDLNGDGAITDKDVEIIIDAFGPCPV